MDGFRYILMTTLITGIPIAVHSATVDGTKTADRRVDPPPAVVSETPGSRTVLRERAGARMQSDVSAYGKDGIAEIERLYQAFSRSGDVENESLTTLMTKYPAANRTGCAVMYAGQRARRNGERWFKLAIEKYSDCYYGDGACVGPYARYYLARIYARTGKRTEADRLIDEIRTFFPDAVTHQGKAFSDILKKSGSSGR